jgi:hypothetical protein
MIPNESAKTEATAIPAPTQISTMEITEMRTGNMKRNSQIQSSLAGVCSVLLVLFAGQPGLAQQSAPTNPAATIDSSSTATTASTSRLPATRPRAGQAAAAENETTAPTKAGGEGIKIHGHWKFVVHDPDGKLVSTREFENSLLTPSEGDWLLASLLLGKSIAADWGVALCPKAGGTWNNGTGAPNYYEMCTTTGPVPIAVLVESASGPFESEMVFGNSCGLGCVPGLQAQLTGNPDLLNPIGIAFTGSYTATQNVAVNAVETATAFCTTDINATNPANPPASNVAPQTCLTLSTSNTTPPGGNSNLTFTEFTGTSLATPQNLTPGQVLTVTVTLSFS